MYTYKLGGMIITDELYHDDLDSMTFGRKDQNELYHYGIKGQSWGKRRFQNEDGSLTSAGRNRYDVGMPSNGSTATNSKSGTFNKTSAVNKSTFASSNGSKSFGGASGGGAKLEPPGSPTVKVYGSFMTPGSKGYELSSGPGVGAGRSVTNKIKSNVSNSVNSGLKAANKLFSNIGSSIADTTNKAANTISNLYTGNNHAQEAERLDNVVQNYERAGDANINAGNQNIDAGNRKMRENLYNLDVNGGYNNNPDFHAGLNQRERGENQIARGEELHKKAAEYGKKADVEQAKYDNAPRQKINNALGVVSDWVGDRARDVSGAAQNAYNGARDAAGQVSDWVGDRAQDVAGAAQNAYNGARELAGQAGQAVSNAASSVRDWGAGAVDKGRQAFENLFGRNEPPVPTLSDPNPQIETETILREDIIPEQRITEQRIPEQRITEQRIPEQRITENRPTVSGSNNVQTWDNANVNGWDNVRTFGDPGMAEIARQFANQQNSQNQRWQAENAQYEQRRKELLSDKPNDVSDEYWEAYKSNGGTRESYDRQMEARKNSQNNRTSNSVLSDKPDNVSDEFWSEYKSNGGTREGFDRTFKLGVDQGVYKEDEYFDRKPITGESLYTPMDYDSLEKGLNDTIDRQNSNFSDVRSYTKVGDNTVDTSRPYHFTFDPNSGQTIVIYDDEKKR